MSLTQESAPSQKTLGVNEWRVTTGFCGVKTSKAESLKRSPEMWTRGRIAGSTPTLPLLLQECARGWKQERCGVFCGSGLCKSCVRDGKKRG